MKGGVHDHRILWSYLELHSRADNSTNFNWGDTVEGRVAAALYDLYDSDNEGFDNRSAGFSPISQIALGSYQISSFPSFWLYWIVNDQYPFLSGLTLWWNTINYVSIWQAFLPIARK